MTRRLLFPLLAVLLGVVVLAGTAEALVRWLQPAPRMQIVRLDQPYFEWTERDDLPLWWDPSYAHGPIRGDACEPGQPVIGVAGDSVLMSIESEGDHHRVADELRDALRDGVGVCVRDGAWPGYLPYQELGMLRWIDEETPVTVAILSVWKEDRHYRHLGGSLYDSELVVHDPTDGLPRPPLPTPKALHRWLFTHARSWEYATIALAPRVYDVRDPGGAYLEAIDWAAAKGIPLIVVEAAPLAGPLTQAVEDRQALPEDHWAKRVEAAARAKGFPYVLLAEALQGEDLEAIRLDTCCHYNRKGHAAVARALLPHVKAALAQAVARSAATTPAEAPTNPGL